MSAEEEAAFRQLAADILAEMDAEFFSGDLGAISFWLQPSEPMNCEVTPDVVVG